MLEKDDVIGDYKLINFLGRGQFGEVWLAEKQLQFSKRKFRHALKFLSNFGDEINLKAAEDEIDTWIEASGHPNVMSVLDMLIHKEHIIIVSEFAEGGSLKSWLVQNGKKAPSHEKALEMILGILRGIEHLHSRNVVHRDLKPDNILLQGNFPRITDFGISRIVSTNSMSTKAMGSPAYMSPESFQGSKSPQCDIWSAGVILYEMLNGTHPYTSETIYGLVASIQQDEPTPLSDNIPLELRKIVENALQKDTSKRFQTAREMRIAVERAIHNLKVKAEASENAIKEEIVNHISTQPIIENTYKEELNNNEIIETQPLEPTQKIITQPQVEIVGETQPSQIQKTKDTNELERGKPYKRDSKNARMSHEVKRNPSHSQTKQIKKGLWILGGTSGLIFGFLIIGSLILYTIYNNYIFRLEADNLDNPKLVDTKSANISANDVTKDTKLTAPLGMVFVSGGEFMMGRDDGKSEAEKPAHKVTVQPFFMDIYETTNEQYAQFVKATNRNPPTEWKNGVYLNGQSKFPVVGVNWEDAKAFCKNAEKRLPTEEEWEFAARGTNNFLYPWGNDWKKGSANADGTSQTFTEVGRFNGKSPFGIYDMVGNAWEWTGSEFKAYPNGKLPEVFAGKANLKTIRGGSFEAPKDFATTTYRLGWAAVGAENYNRTGFRCVKDVEN
jgi:serine/threonine-protein kinase